MVLELTPQLAAMVNSVGHRGAGKEGRMRRYLAVLAVAGFAAGPASAVDLPAHKPGLWQMTMALGADAPVVTIKRCTDAATDTLLTTLASGWADQSCVKQDVKRSGETLVIDSTCKIGPSATTAHAEINGSFDDAYTLKVSIRQQGTTGSSLAGERRLAVDAKWLGACAADQKPGDIILPGGVTMNVRNFKAILGLTAPGR
jgi:hypothetical protein